ncbi:MAG: hypothetical protein QOJ98_3303 [Acidobacteriota bacterium]|jgi:hypothetical protein|nr:hypothetical protein [Acidobacteriota bacterium]
MHAAEVPPTLELTIEQASVNMDEVVEFDVRIVNSTVDDLWIFGDLRWGPRAGLVLNVGPWERDGPLPVFIDHGEFTKEELQDTRTFVRLRSGAFIGRKRQMKASDLVRKPGEYRVWVEYQAPLPANAFAAPFWSAEKPVLVSHPVVLHVSRSLSRKN